MGEERIELDFIVVTRPYLVASYTPSEITKPLVFKRECESSNKRKEFIAVEGTKNLTVDGKLMVIDYGDGTCDNKVTITIDGTSKEVEVNGDN